MLGYKKLYQRTRKKWLRLYQPKATLPAHLVDCPECGEHVQLPKMRQGQVADCPCCGHVLVRVETEPYLMPLATASAALLLIAVVYSQMFVTVTSPVVYARLSLPHMINALILQNWDFLGSVMFVLTFGTPVLFLLLCLYVYLALLLKKRLPWLLYAARVLTRLRQWIMIDVFFMSMLVAYIKINTVAQVAFGAAFWLMPVLALLLLRTSVAVPVHWMYYQIDRMQPKNPQETEVQKICCTRCLHFRPGSERFCGVCGSELFDRRPYSLRISLAFLLAALILYLPANLLPIMISSKPTKEEISTILSGIVFMWNDGDKLIAVLIFSASVAVPVLKILSMLVLLYSAYAKPLLPVRALSLQYRITEAVGRWSMIDVFVIIILMTTFYTPVARVVPGPAVVYFCLVVVLTMFSAYFFDMRLIWDRQRHRQQSAPDNE